ncbi:MAG: hypothetical protein WBF33_23760 [Candidatus Nitrosopolaris sp.]|jgi:hypothetical protein
MPISTPSKWYPRKAPTLQIKILNLIAIEGQVSKTMAKKLTGSHHADVSNAIDELAKKKFIELKLTSFLHPKTRQRKFFQLTHNGIQAFIDGKPSPAEFWKAIYLFCKLSERKIDMNTFDALYRHFQDIYLGYTPHHGHFFQFRFIDILFKKWLKDNDKIYDPARDNIVKGVVISRRILECLGMNRLVTLGQLCQHIEEQRPVFEHVVFGDEKIDDLPILGHSIDSSEESINSALEEFTLPGDYRGPYYSHRPDLRYELDWILNQYADFIQHLVVVPRLEKGETRYELSLFGIALLLSVRARQEFVNPDMLFYNNLEFREFCSKLSTNYKDKLPLIFGKWDSLMRETLRDNNVIFEILCNLFYDHTSKAMIESSVIVGGVKEYYESVQTLSGWSYPRLDKIHKAGEEILEELAQSKDCYCHKLLSRKMHEISNSLSQRNLNRFMENLHADGAPNTPIRDRHRIYANELVYIEKALADEISFLFYIFFYVRDPLDRHMHRTEPLYSTYFPDMFKPFYWTRTVHMENGVNRFVYEQEIKTEEAQPLQSFVNIIRKHEEVQRLLVTWIDDASKCQNDVQSKISGLKNYTRKGD